jgi:Ser/Thr protein kinase RdoA (MazF antagonist)
MNHSPSPESFAGLTPELVLEGVEKGLGRYVSNLCRPMNSYINRVYELADEDGEGIIAKFYRPSRWSRAAILEEHGFLLELAEAEIPVIAPLELADGTTLAEIEGIPFALFPKRGGRLVDEYSDDQWLELGRLLGRVHAVGAARPAEHRLVMAPDRSTRRQVDFLLAHGGIPPELEGRFRDLTTAMMHATEPPFSKAESIRIHGDCHGANLIHRPDESFFIIDFDDMCMGPPIQDIWMLLPDVPENCLVELDLFLEGYESFRHFSHASLRLIEPLRAMRFIHYMAWCAHQFMEDGHSVVMPDFGTRPYWQRELNDLEDQLERIGQIPQSYLPG